MISSADASGTAKQARCEEEDRSAARERVDGWFDHGGLLGRG